MDKRNFFYKFFGFFSPLTPQIVLALLSVAVFLLVFIQFSHAKCINNYSIQQKKMRHYIPSAEINKLELLAKKGKVLAGWELAYRWGDPYARLAAVVLSGGNTYRDRFYQRLIAVHWINTNNPKIYREFFHAVARKHFNHYVKILKTGYWPDSDQIVSSYLSAVRESKLPDVTVLDAAWEAAGFNYFRSWQSLNQFPEPRVVFPTRACMNVNKALARKILALDFLEIPFNFIFSF